MPNPVVHQVLTLEPLRTQGAEALDPAGLEGIFKITLLEIEVAWDNELLAGTITKANDIFQCAAQDCLAYEVIPKAGRLVQAAFLLQFAEQIHPQRVEIRPPATLKTSTDCDLAKLEGWLQKRGFAMPAQ